MVEWIYPTHMRLRYDQHKAAKTDSESEDNADSNDPLDDINDEDLGSLQSMLDLSKIASNTRFAVVIDRPEHLQGIMDLVSLFSPMKPTSDLHITAFKCVEPTFTEYDSFLGRDERGKLIKTEQEMVDIGEIVRDFLSIEKFISKRNAADLLSFSMLAKSIGSEVSAFKIQGNPDEFPGEIKRISNDYDCELTLLPWRPAVYLQKLFWQFTSTTIRPIALVVQAKTEVQVEPDGKVVGSGGNAVHIPPAVANPTDRTKRRMSMKYNTERHYSMQYGMVDVGNRSITVNHGADRKGSRTSSGQADDGAHTDGRTKSSSNAQYEPVPELMRRHYVNRVVAIITGSRMDTAIIPMLLRFLERPNVVLTLFVPNDTKHMETNIRESYGSFKLAVKNNPNVTITKLDCPHTDLPGTFKSICDAEFDLFVAAFVAPPHIAPSEAPSASGGSADIEGGQARKRSKSVSEMVASTLIGYEPQPEEVEVRIRVGCPPDLAVSHLEYPELGYYGSRLYEAGHDLKYIVIVHEPKLLSKLQRRMTQRAMTMSSSSPPPASSVDGHGHAASPAAAIPTSLNAIAEGAEEEATSEAMVEMVNTSSD